MDRERYDVLPIGITRDGRWVPGVDDPQQLQLAGATTEVADSPHQIAVMSGSGELVEAHRDPAQSRTVVAEQLGEVDVVIPLLHGPFGEDGTIQGMLEMAGIRYVGSGVLASAAAMDKHMTKIVLNQAGIRVGPFVVVTKRAWLTDRDSILDDVERLTLPLFVKPARAGSSLGITRVTDLDQLEAAVEAAQQHDPKVIIEQGIPGREIECAVLGGRGTDRPRTSVLGEIILEGSETGFYDFEAKYVETEGLTMSVPAEVSEAASDEMRDIAARTFDALGCEGMARVDFFYGDDGIPVVNEVNTIPGFTPFSMYPLLWKHTGLEYPELIDELIALALERPVGLR